MSKVQNSRAATARPASAVDPEMLAMYRRAARAPSLREDIRALMALSDDYQILIAAGDLLHALGAGIQLVDVALRIAATPGSTARDRRNKASFFESHLPSLVKSFGYGHVALIADAAVGAERALPAYLPHAGH